MSSSSARTVVVTGASAGVGRATARALGRRGDHVVAVARGRAGLDATVADVREAGGQAVAVQADVADPEAVERAAAQAEEVFGPIDVWINNAMATVVAPFGDVSARDLQRVTEVTYLGSVHGFQAALRRMRPRDRGTIVQVGSVLARRGMPLQSAYCGAQHALRGVTESLQAELRRDGSDVRVVAVQLPGVNTPQFEHCRTTLDAHPRPATPTIQPEVAADAILSGADSGRERVLAGASRSMATWGSRLAPGLVERYIASRADVGRTTSRVALDPHRPDNLWSPTDDLRDEGAHGPFDHAADAHGPPSAAEHPVLAAVAAAGLAGAVWAARGRATRRPAR